MDFIEKEPCPWCYEMYIITPENEKIHLEKCSVYNTLPVAELTEDGKTFVALPSDPSILVERPRKKQ